MKIMCGSGRETRIQCFRTRSEPSERVPKVNYSMKSLHFRDKMGIILSCIQQRSSAYAPCWNRPARNICTHVDMREPCICVNLRRERQIPSLRGLRLCSLAFATTDWRTLAKIGASYLIPQDLRTEHCILLLSTAISLV